MTFVVISGDESVESLSENQLNIIECIHVYMCKLPTNNVISSYSVKGDGIKTPASQLSCCARQQ